MSNNSYHFIGAQEFCSGCGRTKRCDAIVETSGHIDCWCKECWDDFLCLAYKVRENKTSWDAFLQTKTTEVPDGEKTVES